MELPIKFRLGSGAYSVVRMTSLPRGMVGQVRYGPRIIEIAMGPTNKPRPTRKVSETFWHETTHAILYDMNHRLWRNEAFVTEFSKRLNQVVLSARLP